MKCFIFPQLILKNNENEYIGKLYKSIKEIGFVVSDVSYSKKNLWALFTSLGSKYDLIYLNWFGLSGYSGLKGIIVELFHFLVFNIYLIKGSRIVFVVHNFKPHIGRLYFSFFHNFYYKKSNLIICHSTIIYDLLCKAYYNKTVVIPHPTKPELLGFKKPVSGDYLYDFLVWGNISEYKGIREIVIAFKNIYSNYKLAIVGRCSDPKMSIWLESMKAGTNIHVDLKNIDDSSIIDYHQISRHVLFNYLPNSAIISGAVMYSISLGSKVCMRRGNQYNDLSDLGCLFLFDSFESLIVGHCNYNWQLNKQIEYVLLNDWSAFRVKLERLLK